MPEKEKKIVVTLRRRGAKPMFNEEQSLEFCRRYMAGETATQIAKSVGTSNVTVLASMRRVADVRTA